ncbi:MAG TPA: YtxH domain-containing protein [Bacteroidales bacterium]|nr:YtxH domain-containing protein [Bacteroidales bacterium]HPT21706.1 YtxH domain-containing protein [Bacteroidales bacterium]
MKSTGSFITGLLAGAVIGGAIALLYAPKSGKDTREQIKHKLDDLEKEFETLKDNASQKSDHIRKNMADRLAELKNEIESLSRSI